MARKPMTEEQKKKLSEQAKARIAAKKAEEQQNAQPTPAEATAEPQEQVTQDPVTEVAEVSEPELPEVSSGVEQNDAGEAEPTTPEPQGPEAAPAVEPASDQAEQADEPEQAKPKDYADHLASVQEARDEVTATQSRYPDMIEAKQAADALNNAVYSMERVRDTLASK